MNVQAIVDQLSSIPWDSLTQIGLGSTAIYYARQCLALSKVHSAKLADHDTRITKLEQPHSQLKVQGYRVQEDRRRG